MNYCRFVDESQHWTTSLWPFYRSHWQLLHVLWSFWCKRVGCPIWRYASPCNWFGVDVSLVMWPPVWSPWEICFLVGNRWMAWYQRCVLPSQIPGVSWRLQRYVLLWLTVSLFFFGCAGLCTVRRMRWNHNEIVLTSTCRHLTSQFFFQLAPYPNISIWDVGMIIQYVVVSPGWGATYDVRLV